MRTLPPAITFTMLLLAACSPGPGGGAAVQAPTGDKPSAATGHASAAMPADVATRYACDPDTVVDVLEDGRARVTLLDGRKIELGRITGSDPPVYRGDNLFFTVGQDKGHLSQESGRELACRPQ